jgi:hypothetical protein
MSWWRSRRFSAATTARGGKESSESSDYVAKEVEHRVFLDFLPSQVQPFAGWRVQFPRRTPVARGPLSAS